MSVPSFVVICRHIAFVSLIVSALTFKGVCTTLAHINRSQKLALKVGIIVASLDNSEDIDNERLQRLQNLPLIKPVVLSCVDSRQQYIPNYLLTRMDGFYTFSSEESLLLDPD